MPSKFSLFARDTKEIELKAKQKLDTSGEQKDSIPAKDKNPDDLEIK
ncbi:MAG: hypothetical protein GX091_00150 [Peptococcaceae bacterium]|nr:hypothetical protein [Peptococcaceae bacterium]